MRSIILIVFSVFALAFAEPTPIVLMHGIAASSQTMAHVADLLRANIPGVYIHNAEVGNGYANSIMWDMNKQAQSLCNSLKADPKLRGGFNLFAVSQGGLISRGFIERCNDPPIHNVVFWLSPQAGVFGVPIVEPWCDSVFHNSSLCNTIDTIFGSFVYTHEAQSILSFAGYWVDPYKISQYQQRSEFLADLDNLRGINEKYRSNFKSIRHLLLVHSTTDTTLMPREASLWETYYPGQRKTIQPLRETDFYKKDLIGLRTLDESGRLHFAKTTLPHPDYFSSEFDAEFIKHCLPVLKRA